MKLLKCQVTEKTVHTVQKRGRTEGGGVVGLWCKTFGLRSRGGKPEQGCAGWQLPGGKKIREHVVPEGGMVENVNGGSAIIVLYEDLGGLFQSTSKELEEQEK